MRARPGRAAALALAAAVAAGVPAGGQEPEAERGRTCRLVLEPTTDSTESVSVEAEPDTYVTYVRGGLRWTCGSARMVADSAVRYEGEGRLEMIRSVDYRDSIRTLQADRVTYFEREDRIVAQENVRLTRRATGSRLEGPRVEFLRVTGEEERRTLATGRPRLWLRRDTAAADTAAADTAPPVRIDADRIVLLGEQEARVRGDVVIRRRDVEARSDSAVFRPAEETGELYGSPEVTGGDGWRLTGRTLRMRFEDDELREVVTEDDGHAEGDDFELFAPRIRARVEDEELERLWAYGDERPAALSPPYRLRADSLDIVFTEGEIAEVRAVRDAHAVDVGAERPADPRGDVPLTAGDRSWVAADTITLVFAEESPGADSIARPGDGPGRRTRTPAAPPGARPLPPADTAGSAPAEEDVPPAVLPPADSLVDVTGGAGPGEPAAARDEGATDGDGDAREIRTVRATGEARAYHLLEPDEPGGPPGRHYQRGQSIVIHFEEGEAVRIDGEDAIGVHLDPTGETPVQPPGPAAPGPAEDTIAPDTVAAPADSARPDTARADTPPPDTLPPDTVRDDAPGGSEP